MTSNSRTLSCAILISGNEILDGRVIDTNSNLLSARLTQLGALVSEIATLPDDPAVLIAALKRLSQRNRIVFISGGLGPTKDDWTREIVAQSLNRQLVKEQSVVDAIRSYFASRGRVMSPNNEKQALFPEGSTIIKNSKGSAPGFYIEGFEQTLIIALPGIPWELEAMLEETVLGLVKSTLPFAGRIERRLFRVFGLPESEVGQRVEKCNLPDEVTISYRVAFPEIQVTISAANAESLLADSSTKITAALEGERYVFSNDHNTPLEVVIHRLLIESKLTLAVAESCTGGLLGGLLTKTPGSSSYFLGGIQSYSNQLKSSLLAVPDSLIRQHGAVSSEVATAMALGAKQVCGSSLALSITGIAGPDGGTAEKPVGTFFVALATERGDVRSEKFFYPTSRERIRTYACWCALNILREHLGRRI